MPRFVVQLLLLCVAASAAPATNLRIETRVYQGGEDKPFRESVTLFEEGVVYDFRQDASRVTIFRHGVAGQPGRFILLDTQREVKTEISADRVEAVMGKLRDWASKQEDEFVRFTADPRFEEDFNKETGELRMVSDRLSYRLVTIPTDHERMKLPVRRFLDSFARLQTLLDSGLPPEPRLRVNEALFRHGVMPVEVHLAQGRMAADGSTEPDLWADHLTAWVLSKRDRARIEEAIDQMASFKQVSNEVFQRGQAKLAAK